MPFESEKQRRFMWAKHPDIAQRWTDKYGATPRHEDEMPKKKSSKNASTQALRRGY